MICYSALRMGHLAGDGLRASAGQVAIHSFATAQFAASRAGSLRQRGDFRPTTPKIAHDSDHGEPRTVGAVRSQLQTLP